MPGCAFEVPNFTRNTKSLGARESDFGDYPTMVEDGGDDFRLAIFKVREDKIQKIIPPRRLVDQLLVADPF